ncbi:MAG: capsule assembly Wzi family protein [Clostridia bacterium]|nr:capsule assembly Wzi family protein [Clostridia bacterium]
MKESICSGGRRPRGAGFLALALALAIVVGSALPGAAASIGSSAAGKPAYALTLGPYGAIAVSGEAWAGVGLCHGDQGDAASFGLRSDGLELLLTGGANGQAAFVGMASFKWGPGRSGSLVLSGIADPMPVAGYRLSLGSLEYVRFVGAMESEQKRALMAQRIEYSPWPWLTLGITETAAVSGEVSPVLFLPVPGLPVYALQHLAIKQHPVQDRNINVNMGVDFRAEFPISRGTERKAEAYGEFFADDAHLLWDPDPAPYLVGVLAGIDVPEIPGMRALGVNLEYVGIANFVYSHKNPINNYTYHDAPLGHPLGPDADTLILTVSYRCSPKSTLTLSGAVERHGEGYIGHSWSPGHGMDEAFLTGVVEKTAMASLGWRWAVVGPLSLNARIGFAAKGNYRHVEGTNWAGWNCEVGVGVLL